MKIPPADRFWRFVDQTGPCWIWRGNIFKRTGYGQFGITAAKKVLAHRFAFELLRGSIPSELVLDHLCRNRACVNPEHLEPVTMRINLLRGIGQPARNARKIHCNRGHLFTAANTYPRPNGARECRACWTGAKARRKEGAL